MYKFLPHAKSVLGELFKNQNLDPDIGDRIIILSMLDRQWAIDKEMVVHTREIPDSMYEAPGSWSIELNENKVEAALGSLRIRHPEFAECIVVDTEKYAALCDFCDGKGYVVGKSLLCGECNTRGMVALDSAC